MATLKDISEVLGLSVATVSRALNGFPEVSEKTRLLVEETAEKLNYRPNRAAQKLVTGRSGMVGMLVSMPPGVSAETSLVEIIMGLSARLAERDIDLVMQVIVDADPMEAYRRAVSKNTLDGFILSAPTINDPRMTFLKDHGIPFVVHGKAEEAADYAFYDIDNADAARQGVELLANLRHQHFAYLNGAEKAAFADQRARGFFECLSDRDLPREASQMSYGENTRASGYTRALGLLTPTRNGERPTALLCASTPLAYGALRAARHLGLRIPEDLSIMCHDDVAPILFSDDAEPPLTVTHAPMSRACGPLAECLVGVLGGAAPETQQITERAQLIVRQSTGPAPTR